MLLRTLVASALLSLFGVAFAQEAPAPAPAPAASGPVAYKLDPSKGFIYVQVFKDPDTLASGLSHDHVIRALGWTGSVSWDPANPATCQVDINVPVKQLQADAPDMRQKVGYGNTLEEGQREDVTENMLAEGQLNAAKFANITFKATRCEGSGNAVKVTGNFTMRGVTRSVTVPMTITADGQKLTAKGSFKTNHTDFGFQPYTALLGQLKNKNEMSFTIDVVGARQ